jgi:predicted amidohydrolase
MLIGMATMKGAPWQLEENFQRMEAMVREAAGRRAELVMAPESVLDGYVFNEDPTSTKEEMLKIAQTVPDGEYLGRAGALCRELEIYLIFGFLERESSDLFNACVLLDKQGKVLAHYRKITTAGEYDITPGSELEPFDTSLGRIGFLLCSDRSADNVRTLAVQGAGVIFIPMDGSGGPDNTEKMRWRAKENGCWIAIANTWSAVLISPSGELNLEKYETECVSVQVLSLPWKNQSSFISRRADLYDPLTVPTETGNLYDADGKLTEAALERRKEARRGALEKRER